MKQTYVARAYSSDSMMGILNNIAEENQCDYRNAVTGFFSFFSFGGISFSHLCYVQHA
jgi:hypothetical protein